MLSSRKLQVERPRSDLPMAQTDPGRAGIRVLGKAIHVLWSLENNPEGLSIREIAQVTAMPRSTVQRIVAALTEQNFLIGMAQGKRVRLGPAILQMAAPLDFDITTIMRPFLRRLSLEMQETIDLSVPAGSGVSIIDRISGHRRLSVISKIGERLPLHCTANGKAILAALPADVAERRLARSVQGFSAFPLADISRLMREIETIRHIGIAFDREEHAIGISAIGTAFTNPCGGLVAISVPVPTTRFRRQESQLVDHLLSNRRQIVARLG
ncbi:MAG TPA: IclR family transcriptional regulator [Telmatospirillum sp.]|nr:IclR family transcriptional regulator [Telmatospirillum sp.]